MKPSPRACLFSDTPDKIDWVYSQGRRERVASRTRLHPDIVGGADFDARAGELADVEVIFSTWGMPSLRDEQWARMPALRAVFFAGGSVRGFARPLLERGVTVVSAAEVNAVPVAEFALGQILLANKGYFENARDFVKPAYRDFVYRGAGNYGAVVAILGAGRIGRKLIKLLRPFAIRVLVFDPFLSAEDAVRLGVERVGLAEAFARARVVSNHLADKPETRGLLAEAHFRSMPAGATFINTGRGATVDEDGLVATLAARPDFTALLDVTRGEPPPAESPLYALRNVLLTTHIAGSKGDEVLRMSDFVIDAFDAWQRGEPAPGSVTLDMLEIMA